MRRSERWSEVQSEFAAANGKFTIRSHGPESHGWTNGYFSLLIRMMIFGFSSLVRSSFASDCPLLRWVCQKHWYAQFIFPHFSGENDHHPWAFGAARFLRKTWLSFIPNPCQLIRSLIISIKANCWLMIFLSFGCIFPHHVGVKMVDPKKLIVCYLKWPINSQSKQILRWLDPYTHMGGSIVMGVLQKLMVFNGTSHLNGHLHIVE